MNTADQDTVTWVQRTTETVTAQTDANIPHFSLVSQ